MPDVVLEIVSRRLAELAEPPVTTADMLALVTGIAREAYEAGQSMGCQKQQGTVSLQP